jgi:hypothetical protein
MISDEEAKAAQEVAKLGQKGVEAASDAGGWLAKTFGKAFDHMSEAFADKAAAYRVRNRATVVAKTRAHLEKLGVTDFKAIDFRSGIPLLESISDEPEDSVQDLWAAYLANALDSSQQSVVINRLIINVIKNLDPTDLPVIRRLAAEDLSVPVHDPIRLDHDHFSVEEPDLSNTFARLTALGLFSFENSGSVGYAPDPGWKVACQMEVNTELGEFRATPLLMLFNRSIQQPPSSK